MKRFGLIVALMTLITTGVVAQTKGIGQVNLNELKGLSMAQIMNKAKSLTADSNQMYSSVLNILEKARQAQDSAKVSCLRNLIPAMKGLVRIGQQSLLNLKELSATGDKHDGESEFVKVVISHRKMLEMYNTALQCGSANVKQVFEKGVHVEKEFLPGAPTVDVVDKANPLSNQEDPFSQQMISQPNRFVMVDNANVVPATDFY